MVALASCAPAQTDLVVPAEFADKDASWLAEVAGFSQAFRQQVLLRADELTAVRGRTLTKLAFRRDVQLPIPLRGGTAVMVVRVSDRATHPSAASATFADNRGPAPVEVFRGEVQVPASPAPPKPPVPTWSAPNGVEIVFAEPFVYRDGNLCIELEGRPVPGKQPPAWPVDFAMWSVGGGNSIGGRSCDPRLQAMAVWKAPIPGSVITLFASGPTQTVAVCLLGHERASPTVLTTKRAVECDLRVDPFAAFGFVYPRVKLEQITRVEMPLPLPLLPCVFSQHVAIQWLQMPNAETGAGMATTHVQTVGFADGVHAFAGASVRSGLAAGDQFPDKGEVFLFQMPVVRLSFR